jgi:hypothetical protein
VFLAPVVLTRATTAVRWLRLLPEQRHVSAFRTAELGFDANLAPFLQALAKNPRSRVGKKEHKEQFTTC